MGNNDRDTVERISVSMYPAERVIVDRKATELGVNFSLALRLIIREWDDFQQVIKPQMDMVQQVE